MSARGKRLLVYALVMAAGAVSAKAWRTYRYEVTAFHPKRGRSPKPPEMAAQLRDVAFTTPAGTAIAAWYLPSRNRAAIVYVHGSPSDRLELAPEAAALARAGYGALLLDMPGHGESGGRVTWGKDDQAAVSSAIDFVAAQPEVDAKRIGAFGFSMGTSVVAHVAAKDPRIAAAVLSGAFTSEREQLLHEFRRWGPISRLPAIGAATREGLAFDELVTTDVIALLAPRPVLFIAGTLDPIVPASMVRALYGHAREPKALYVVPAATHGQYRLAAGDAYDAYVRRFFGRALRPDP